MNSILRLYEGSLFKLLATVYPEHGWLPWKFPRHLDYWSDNNSAKQFIEYIAKQLNTSQINKLTTKVKNKEILSFLCLFSSK